MARVNLTLDSDTYQGLQRFAKRERARVATFARSLLREGISRREAAEQARKLAADYAAGRPDAEEILAGLERAQLEILDDEAN